MTPEQHRIIEFIEAHYEHHRKLPTIGEICAGCCLTRLQVAMHIVPLVVRGDIPELVKLTARREGVS